ncbi:MAG: magnesium transporter [Acidobacteriota bacterium]
MPRITWRLDAPLTARATPQAVHTVRKLLHRDAHANLAKLLQRARPADAALLFEALAAVERRRLFAVLLTENLWNRAAAILTELPDDLSVALIADLEPHRLARLLDVLPVDEATRLAERLPRDRAEAALSLMNRAEADAVRELLEHDASTAGRMMSPIVFAGRRAQSVAQAIGALQEESERVQGSLIYLYVVDDDERLCGVVNMRRLLVSKPDTPLERIMDRDVIAVTTETSQEETARLIEQYHLMALPVIDAEEVLVGQVTVDDVIDVLQDEATEELLALSGVSVDERPDTPATRSLRLRAPWLVINLGTAFLAASVVGMFTGTIGKLPALAALMPIVAGMGGNAATQALTVVVRALALEQIPGMFRVLSKEVLVGLGNGALNGAVCFLVGAFLFRDVGVGAVLAVALLINMVVAGVAGSMMPMILKRYGIDPAVASAVFVTTCTDVGGFFTFLGLATLLLRWKGM